MMLVGPLTLYAHENTDEDYDDYIEEAAKVGIPARDAEAFITSNPLYEVTFVYYLDLDSGTAHCTQVDLGDGEPFTRALPS